MKKCTFVILLLSILFNSLTSETADGISSLIEEDGIEDTSSAELLQHLWKKLRLPCCSTCTYNLTLPSGSISKNGSLNPSDECVWNVIGNDSFFGSSGLLFEKVHLDANDTLIITNSTGDVIFGPYNGTQGPLVIVVDEKNFTVKLSVSKKRTARTFQILYSENCIFSIPPMIETIESPIYRVKPKVISCTYDYNKIHESVSYSFVFTSFNLNSESNLNVMEAEGPIGVYTKTPPDIFGPLARFNMTLNISSTGNNLRIVRRDLYHPCTKFMEVFATTTVMLRSPPAMTSHDDFVNFECRWLIKGDANSVVGLAMDKLLFNSVFDMLIINDGPSELSAPLIQATLVNQEDIKVDHVKTAERWNLMDSKMHPLSARISVTCNSVYLYEGQTIRSSTPYLWISFKSEAFASNFSGNGSQNKGGYHKGSGSISSQSDAQFLLEVDRNEKVLLNFSSSEFSSPVRIYDGFSTTSALIAQLGGNVWYPVVSGTSKMMVVAKDFSPPETFTAHFSGIKSDCIHMSALSDDTYVVSGNCNMTCVWVVPPKNISEKVLVLEFHLLSLDVDDVIEVFRLGDNKTSLAKITHSTEYVHVPPLAFDPREGFYMNVSRGKCYTEDVILVAHSTYLPGCSRNISLMPSSKVQLYTPNYPDVYPLLSSCEWNLVTSGSASQFYLAFESLNLAPGHCIKINHTVGGVTKTEVFGGDKLPNDMLFQNVGVNFDSFNCNKPSAAVSLVSGEGFILNVTSSDCGSIMKAKAGQFNTSLAASKGQSACFWIIQVPYNETDGSVNSVMFTVEEKDVKNNNSEFHIHDGPSVREPVITNYTGNIWSRNNTVIFVYKSFNSSVPSDVFTVNYKTINCNKTNQCGNGICLHPDWRCNGKNDCGDFTDETNCGTIPVPEPQKETNKISAVTFGVVTVLFFVLGALTVFLIPKAINRYRSERYHQFQDYPNVD